jgi:hypothetical protein
MHVLGRRHEWNREAAELGARLLAAEERNVAGANQAASPESLCERAIELVIRESARVVLATALAHDPGIETRAGSWGRLGDRLIGDVIAGVPFAHLVRAELGLTTPLVAIGAPVQGYYPEVARRLRTVATIPEHAAVCNAVGAVVGVVSQTVEILVNQPAFGVFRVHDPAGIREFKAPEPAIECAREIGAALALAAARQAGAPSPMVETSVIEHRAQMGAADYLAEAVVRAIATGRPFAGHTRSMPT